MAYKKPIRVAKNEVIATTPAAGANGALLTMALTCGNCAHRFKGMFSMAELSIGFPHVTCEECQTINYVPYTISGRSGN